jgi:hypothetical protein
MTKARDLANLGNKTSLDEINDAYNAGALSNRNLIINGDFKVAQRGTTFAAAASDTVVSDRWAPLIGGAAGGKIGFTRSTDAPEGFKYSTKLDVSTAMSSLASNDFYIFKYKGFERQDIEHLNFGTSDAKQLTLSFWVKSNKTGTMYAELQIPTSSASMELSRPYTINAANTWEKKTLTWIPNTAHTPNSGDNGAGMYLYMWIASGSNQTGSPLATTWNNNSNRITGITNYLDSTSNEIYFTGFQLEVGDTATPFEHRSYGDELAKCQRYYERIQAVGSAGYIGFSAGTIYGSGTYLGHFTASVPMRATPAFSTDALNSTSRMSVVSGDNTYSISSIAVTGNNQRLRINAAGALSGIIGQGAYIQVQNAHHVAFDAEL